MLPFFSAEERDGLRRIVAAAGVKSLVLPREYMEGALSALEGLSPEGHTVAELVERLGRVLEEGRSVPSLAEELSHFRCVAESQISSALHIRNFITRLLFTDWNSRHGVGSNPLPCPVHCEVLRYHRDAAIFFARSTPWIEGKFVVESKKGVSKDVSSYFQSERIDSSARLLAEVEASVEDVAVVIDLTTLASLEDPTEAILRARRRPLQSRLYRAWRGLKTLFPLLRFARLYPLLLGVIWRTYRSLPSYLWGRLVLRGNGAGRAHGKMPGILSEGVTVDPAAFGEGRAYHESQEKTLESNLVKAEADLLWTIMRVMATSFVLENEGMTEAEVRAFWSDLLIFNSSWRPAAADAEGLMVRWCSTAVRRIRGFDRSTSVRDLTVAAVELYRDLRDEVGRRLLQSDGVRAALNAHYMHV